MTALTPLLIALALAAPLPVAPPAPIAEWTFMVYMDADCDLEEATLVDLDELAAAGSSAQVNVVVLVDRAAAGDEDEGYSDRAVANLRNWSSAKLLFAERGRFRELADWGEVNLADGAVLRRFVETVRRTYPARRYALVIGDHGSAWPGVVADDSSPQEHDLLTVNELSSALGTALAGQPLDLLGFDACLMGNYETARALAPVARTLVASEELEPDSGWDYTTALRALAAQPGWSGVDLGRAIANAFHASYHSSDDEALRDAAPGVTLAVVALDRMAGLNAALDNLADELQKALTRDGREAWLHVAAARAATEQYGTLGDPEEPPSSLHDLADFARQVAALVPDASIKSAASAVERAVNDVVVHNVRGRARPNAHGLSIFFPPDGATLAARDPVAYADVAPASAGRWLPFLKSYTSSADGDHEWPGLDPTTANRRDVSVDRPIRVSAKVKADDVDEAHFVIEEAQGHDVYVIGKLPAEPDEHGRLEDEWDGDWFTIGTARQRVVCPITDMQPASDDEAEQDGDDEQEDTAVPGIVAGTVVHAGVQPSRTEAGVRPKGQLFAVRSDEEDTAEGSAGSETYFVEVPVEVGRKGSKAWRDAWLYFLVDFEADDVKGEFVYAFLDGDDGPRELRLRAGDRVRPVYVHVDKAGNEDLVVSEDPADVLTLARGGQDLDVRMGRVEPGEYRVGFMVQDYAGNITENLTAVTVR